MLKIEKEFEVITFKDFIYYIDEYAYYPADLTLETGVFVRDSVTNQFARFELQKSFTAAPLDSNVEISVRSDVQLNVIGHYDFIQTTPPQTGQPQITTATFSLLVSPAGSAVTYELRINGVTFTYNAIGGETIANVTQVFLDEIETSNDPRIRDVITVTRPTDSTIVLTGVSDGFAFNVSKKVENVDPADGGAISLALTQAAQEEIEWDGEFTSKLKSTDLLEADAIFRANYYLQGMLLKYQITGALTLEYNGIMPITCDGAISQVTWQVGDGRKCSTIASRNSEHSTYLPPYPARRRAEVLRAISNNPYSNRDPDINLGDEPGEQS